MADETHAILAEMRAGVCTGPADALAWASAKLHAYADRIEAAAKREREAAQSSRDTRDAMDYAVTSARPFVGVDLAKDKPTFVCATIAPGNAAAMRDALEECRDYLYDVLRDAFNDAQVAEQIGNPSTAGYEREQKLHKAVEAALSAPARNCDVSRDTKETIERCLASLNVESSSASFDAGVCAAIGWMLAAPAEGCVVSKPLGRPATEKEVESRFSGVVWCQDCSTPCPLSHSDALSVCEHYSAPAEKGGAE